jgi:5-methylcytosine-specific restriction endonuclease McrA
MDAKKCGGGKGCGETKPVSEFYRQSSSRDGFGHYCKVCAQAAKRARYAANPERDKAAKKRYADANRDKTRAAVSRWRDANRDRKRETDQQWRDANPDKVRAWVHRRRAAKLSATVGSVDYAVVCGQPGSCYLCGDPLDQDTHMDHVVPLSRGGAHSYANVLPAHEACNLRKSDRLLTELDWYRGPTGLGAAGPQRQLTGA